MKFCLLFLLVFFTGCRPADPVQNSLPRSRYSLRGIYTVDPPPRGFTRWLSGTVAIPEDQPADQPVALLAHELGRKKIRRCVVSPDGRFRIGVHRDAEKVRIEFDSRFLYLPEPLVVEPKRMTALNLRPLVGSSLTLGVQRPCFTPIDEEWLSNIRVRAVFGEGGVREAVLAPELGMGGHEAYFDMWGLPSMTRLTIVQDGEGFRVRRKVLKQRLFPRIYLRKKWVIDRGIRLAGRIVDEHGGGVVGATIHVSSFDERNYSGLQVINCYPGPGLELITDSEGRFDSDQVECGRATFSVTKPGWVSFDQKLEIYEDGDESLDLQLTMKRLPTITGQVLRADGSPAAGATLDISPGAWRLERVTASSDGSFVLSGREGIETFRVHARLLVHGELQELLIEEAKADGPPVSWTLGNCVSPAGRVIDDVGEPVQYFEIRGDHGLVTREPSRPGRSNFARGFSKESGLFSLPGLSSANGRLHITAVGFEPSSAVALESLNPSVSQTFVLKRQATVTGRVVDSAGQPVIQVPVVAALRDQDPVTAKFLGRRNEVSALTDGRGEFSLNGLTPGRVTIRAKGKDRGWKTEHASTNPMTLEFEPGEVREGLEFVLPRPCSLTVRVHPFGGREWMRPVYLRSLDSNDWAQDTSNHEDLFEFPGLSPGRYRVYVQDEDGRSVEREITLSESEAASITLGNPADKRFPLTLEVWHDGSPLRGAEVRMQTWGDGREVRGATDAEGFCHLSPSARGNSHIRVRLSPEGSFVDFDWFFARDSEPEASRRALQVETHRKLRLDIPSGLLRCRVFDSEGVPAEGIAVHYEGGSGGTHLATRRLVVTDETGEAVVWGVPEADCSLSVVSGTRGESSLQEIGPLRPSASFESATVHELRLAPRREGGQKGEEASKE